MAHFHRSTHVLALLALFVAVAWGPSLWSGAPVPEQEPAGGKVWEYATYTESGRGSSARYTFVSASQYEQTSGDGLESAADRQDLRMALAKILKMDYPRKTRAYSSRHQMLNLFARHGWEVFHIDDSGNRYELRRRVAVGS